MNVLTCTEGNNIWDVMMMMMMVTMILMVDHGWELHDGLDQEV